MTEIEFGELLGGQNLRHSILKEDLYDFTNDHDDAKLAKFIKDVISFCNTIRQEKSYIVFGVKENQDGTKEKIGIPVKIDDAILQDKIKDKIYPRANFFFYTISYQGILFGVLEFPIVRYEIPITSTSRMKGLETGKVYYRQGTTNCEALRARYFKN